MLQVVELTYNYGRTSYSHGNGYSHLAISTRDAARSASHIEQQGGRTIHSNASGTTDNNSRQGDAGSAAWYQAPINASGTKAIPTTGRVVVTTDPDGYKVALVEAEL